MKKVISLLLLVAVLFSVVITPALADNSASVVYYVNGETVATIENLAAGEAYMPDITAQSEDDNKYFAGWTDENGNYILREGLVLKSGENKLIASFKDYPDKVNADLSYTDICAALPNFDENGENFLNYCEVNNGYTHKNYITENGESYLKLEHRATNYGSTEIMQLVDSDGAVIQLKKNTKYYITVTYKLPDYKKDVTFYSLAGISIKDRNELNTSRQGIAQKFGSLVETTDASFVRGDWNWNWISGGNFCWKITARSNEWQTTKFSYTTGDFNGYLPTSVISVSLPAATADGYSDFYIKSVEIRDESYVEPVKVNYYVGETLEETKEIKASGEPYVPERLPSAATPKGKYFAGWGDKDGNVASSFGINTNELNLYAVYKDYASSYTLDMTDNYNTDTTVKYVSFIANDSKGEYSATFDRGGWSYRGFEGEGAALYATASWGQSGSFIFSDKDGNAIVAEPNSSYKVTVEYKVADIVTADEVPEYPDGTKYGGGSVTVNFGIGLPLEMRHDIKDSNLNNVSTNKTYKAVTDWITEEYVFETGSLVGEAAVFGARVNCSGIPSKRTETGKVGSDPADKSYGLNKVIIRKVIIEKNPNVTFVDSNGNVLVTKAYEIGEKIDFSKVFEGNDVILEDGTGYTVESALWYSDKECNNALTSENTFAKAGDYTIYASLTPLTNKKQGQVSFYGFEDLSSAPSGFSKADGFGSGTALKSASGEKEVNITPNVLLGKDAYSVEFYYKGSGTLKLNDTEVVLENAAEWTKKAAVVYAKERIIKMSVTSGELTLDTFSVNKTVSLSGASILNSQTESEINKQAIRVYASYFTDEEIQERGIVLLAGETEELTENTANAIVTTKTSDFDTCWKEENGVITFSNYITDLYLNDTRNLTARAYIKTADGNKFYTEQITLSVDNVKKYYSLLEQNTTYNFGEKEVLDLIKVNGAYEALEGGVTLDWSASGLVVSAYCVGEMEFSIHTPVSHFNQTYTIYLDGERLPGFYELEVVNAELQMYSISVDVGTIPAVHTVELVRRAEVNFGLSEAVSVNINGNLVKAEENDILIEFIGDSITCGMGNIDAQRTARSGDGTSTYAFLAAKKANADWRVRSRSGSGFHQSASGGHNVQHTWDLTYPLQNPWRNKEAAYENKREADIVCIYLGTNDNTGWQQLTGKTMAEDEDTVVAEMKEMISIVKQYNPNAKVIWINGGMTNAYAPMSRRAIAELGGDEAGYYVCEMPEKMTSGGQGHPTAEQHKQMSEVLYNLLVEKDLV